MRVHENAQCPTHQELAAFATGDLPDACLEELALHLDECSSCERLFESALPSYEVNLLSELRNLGLRAAELKTQSQQHGAEVPEALHQAACDAKDSSANPVSFDVGRRLANELRKGGCRLGRFELHSELGVGSFGYVFKGLDTQLGRWVALKVQRAGSFASEEDVERFLREAQSIAQLNHQGIVAVYDTVRSDEGICYLVSEFIDGESLASKLEKKNFSFCDSAELVAQIGDALHYAHEHGIIHRDVKPSNVLIDNKGNPHVMDFGLAKRDLDTEDTMTSEGRILGSPAYMSPEQAIGDSAGVDSRSDVFSLGVMLYEMLTGERPFQGNRRMLLLQVMEDDPRPLRQLLPNIPKDLETICLKALSKLQGCRYQSAAEMSDDLRRFTQDLPIRARPIGFGEKFWRWCRSYPLAAGLLVAVPIVTLGGFAYLSWLSTHFVHSTALESTRMEANMLENINEYYSESVIGRLDQTQVPVTHQYIDTPNSLPLPFTFMIDAAEQITDDESGMQVKIFSENPWRQKCGPQDDFELRAIEALSCKANKSSGDESEQCYAGEASANERSYYEFGLDDGEPVLRYARAQIMQQSCVNCHNNEVTSPKRDWTVGEVAGVLSITRPLRRDIESTRAGLRSAFYLIAVVATSLVGLFIAILWTAQSRKFRSSGVPSNGNS
ncbi:MAG: protein kinase [Planctomycetota bacterium]